MPVAPYNWLFKDFPSASRLTTELRQTGGMYFQPNGVRFHATRPVYRNFAKVTPGSTSGAWTGLATATPGSWIVLADTGTTNAGPLDPNTINELTGSNLVTGGGLIPATGVTTNAGGLGLLINNFGFNAAATGQGAAGWGTSAGSHLSTGTYSPFPTASQAINAFAVDLLDWGTAPLSPMYWTNGGGPLTASSTDGSGDAARTSAFWASVYPANGVALSGSSLPSITTGVANGNLMTPAILNASIAQTMQLFNMPPAMRAQATAGTAVPANTNTTVAYSAATTDTYGKFSSNTYTCPLPGLYLVYVCGGFDSCSGATVVNHISVNGTVYNGPSGQSISGRPLSTAAMRVFNLNAGDTIQHVISSGTALTTSTGNAPVFVVLWLGAAGAPQLSNLPVPDATYPFTAGTPASSMAGLLNTHVFDDLSRLLYRPYAMAYQSSAQTGLTQSVYTTVNMQTVGCPVHSTSDNSYGSWSSGTWTAPTSGWYLVVGEVQCGTPSLTTACYVVAGIEVSPAGLTAVDQYQSQGLVNSGAGGGAGAIGIYYLAAGDTVSLQVDPIAQSSTTSSLFISGATSVSHMEVVWLGE